MWHGPSGMWEWQPVRKRRKAVAFRARLATFIHSTITSTNNVRHNSCTVSQLRFCSTRRWPIEGRVLLLCASRGAFRRGGVRQQVVCRPLGYGPPRGAAQRHGLGGRLRGGAVRRESSVDLAEPSNRHPTVRPGHTPSVHAQSDCRANATPAKHNLHRPLGSVLQPLANDTLINMSSDTCTTRFTRHAWASNALETPAVCRTNQRHCRRRLGCMIV